MSRIQKVVLYNYCSPADGGPKYKLDYIRSFFAYSCKGPIVVAPHTILCLWPLSNFIYRLICILGLGSHQHFKQVPYFGTNLITPQQIFTWLISLHPCNTSYGRPMCWYRKIPVLMFTAGFIRHHRTLPPLIFLVFLGSVGLCVVFLNWERMKTMFNWSFFIGWDVFRKNKLKWSTTDAL